MRARIGAVALVFLPSLLCGQAPAVPDGWRASQAAAAWTFTPTRVPAGRTVTLTVEPGVALAGQSVDQWFATKVKADLARRGTVVTSGSTAREPNGVRVSTRAYRDPSGHAWTVLCAATPRANGDVQFSAMVFDVPASMATEYVRGAGTIVGTMATATAAPAPAAAATPPATRAAPAGAGVSDDQIEAVLHEGRGKHTASGFAYVESVDLLLRDGSAYLGLTVPPEDFDVAASRQREPAHWHRWRRAGTRLEIDDGKTGQWSAIDADRARPLAAGSGLRLHLVRRNATGFGGMGSYNTAATIVLQPTGRFERSASVLAGSGVVQSGAGFSASAASHVDQNGRRSSASGTFAGGTGGGVTATSSSRTGGGNGSAVGTYTVTGYALEFHDAAGTVRRVLAFYPFADNARVYIDGATFNAN